MRLGFFGNCFRAILLLLAILFTGLAFMWVLRAPILFEINKTILPYYEDYHGRRLNELVQLIRQNPTAHIEKLEALLVEWQAVAKRDRLTIHKSRAFEVIVEQYLTLGNFNKAHQWVREWLQFDDYDLFAYANEAFIFYQDNSTRLKGLEMLEQLHQRFPHHQYISDKYVEALRSEKNFIKAIAVMNLGQGFRRNWQVFGDLGKGFNENDSIGRITLQHEKKNRWSITLPTVDQLNTIRIDLPAGQRLSLSDIRFDLVTERGEASFSPKMEEITVQDLRILSSRLVSDGGKDPYFYWHLPDAWRGQRITVSYSATVSPAYPDWVMQWLSDNNNNETRHLLKQAGVSEVDYLMQASQQLMMKG